MICLRVTIPLCGFAVCANQGPIACCCIFSTSISFRTYNVGMPGPIIGNQGFLTLFLAVSMSELSSPLEGPDIWVKLGTSMSVCIVVAVGRCQLIHMGKLTDAPF